jgi:transcriptional regulator of NAD metabolism
VVAPKLVKIRIAEKENSKKPVQLLNLFSISDNIHYDKIIFNVSKILQIVDNKEVTP